MPLVNGTLSVVTIPICYFLVFYLGSDDTSNEENSDTSTQIDLQDDNSIKYMEISRCISITKILIILLHLFQVTLAYFLMLIVMNFNYWLSGAVILGSTMGHFLLK